MRYAHMLIAECLRIVRIFDAIFPTPYSLLPTPYSLPGIHDRGRVGYAIA
ncbi:MULTISPECIES: hypothetical protein [Moorena]|uniref:Uncharacterized protein n=1 Tax=Moorena producens (strain JHB) TaxID=1454205 RepID=A0A9Q9SSB7_MOOP1|nr:MULTISPECIES: hypothetical protein [Moorena]NEP37527.1 hypothetical protein [Moorena sp. SIO3B2]WAN68711.1 hypothetical protein BJP36_40830 [Moorena producens JHB]